MFTRSIAIILHGNDLEREGLASILQLRERFAATLEAASLEEALALTCVSVALILVDLALPSLKGSAGLSLLTRQFPSARVVGVLSDDQVHPNLDDLDACAHGVICNRLSEDEVRQAVDCVLRGATFKPPCAGGIGSIPCAAGIECIEQDPSAFWAGQDVPPRQREVFRLFRRGLSDGEISAALSVSESTVRYHLNAACKRLGFPNRVAAARSDVPTEADDES